MGETRERGGEYADRANLSVERMSIVPPGTKQQFTALLVGKSSRTSP